MSDDAHESDSFSALEMPTRVMYRMLGLAEEERARDRTRSLATLGVIAVGAGLIGFATGRLAPLAPEEEPAHDDSAAVIEVAQQDAVPPSDAPPPRADPTEAPAPEAPETGRLVFQLAGDCDALRTEVNGTPLDGNPAIVEQVPVGAAELRVYCGDALVFSGRQHIGAGPANVVSLNLPEPRIVERTRIIREEPPPPPPVEGPEVWPAILLVTSDPPGIDFTIDGELEGITPLRVEVPRSGKASVALLYDGEVLREEMFQLRAGKLTLVNFDVTRQLEDQSLDDEEPPRHEVTGTGELLILSPNVYGEVFIEGKNYGYPPVLARGLGVGTHRIELRVRGGVRRSTEALVVRDDRITVRL